jgi:cytochrome c
MRTQHGSYSSQVVEKLANVRIDDMLLAKVVVMSCSLVLAGTVTCIAQETTAAKPTEVQRGKTLFNQCRACHSLDRSGEAATAPNLYGVIGRKVGKQRNFTYSAALLEKKVTWTEGQLDSFLKAPADYAPGTAMAYSGLKDPADRRALIEYLKLMSPAKRSKYAHKSW